MKTFLITLFFVCAASGTETVDEVARRIVVGLDAVDNGLDHTPEGRRRTALTNAEFALGRFMAGDKVPEGVRISYALSKLKEQMRDFMYKEATPPDGKEFAFEVDRNGAWVVDEERTRLMREELVKKIELLEGRLAEIYNPHEE